MLSTTLDKIREEGIRKGREEGLKQGREEGIKQGKEEGLKELIRAYLIVRFGYDLVFFPLPSFPTPFSSHSGCFDDG